MRTDDIAVTVNGVTVSVHRGVCVIAALVAADTLCTRLSVSGEPRFALCGIGQCQECRVTINGRLHQLACQVVCESGMAIDTGARAAK